MLVALRDLTPAGYRKVRDPFCSYRLLLMLLEAKKRNKRNEPRTRLDSTSGKKKGKETKSWKKYKTWSNRISNKKNKIYCRRFNYSTRLWSFQDGRQSFKTFL